MRNYLFTSLFITGFSVFSLAQTENPNKASSLNNGGSVCSDCSTLAIHYTNLMPTRNNTNFKNGNGIDFEFIYKGFELKPDLKFTPGGAFGLTVHNRSKSYPVIVNTGSETVTGTTFAENTMINLDLLLKLEKQKNDFNLYCLGIVGQRWMNTNPVVKTKKSGSYSDNSKAITVQSMPEFGGALGLSYFFHSCIGIDARVSYLQSIGTYNFVDLNSIHYNEQSTKFEIRDQSGINNPAYFSFKIGLVVNLCSECFKSSSSTGWNIGGGGSGGVTPVIVPGGGSSR